MKTPEELQRYRPQPSARLCRVIWLKKRTLWLNQHWLEVMLILFLVFNLLPWLAPLSMKLGWTAPAEGIYTLYSPLCHQMAQRSFFLFGHQITYDPEELPFKLTGKTGTDTLLLRQFRGNSELGWKVAWSDRMVSMYGSLWLAMLLFATLSRSRPVKPLSLWMFILALMPMLLDGGTHLISDVDGLQKGFRYENAWLTELTGHTLPGSFYAGDELGSFNSWMRLLSGITFGFGIVWFVFPYLWRATEDAAQTIAEQLKRAAELYNLTNEV